MRIKKRVLPALLLSVFAGAMAPAASAQSFSNVYVFGDSLSDAGYFRPFLAGIGLPAPLVATLGRFTTNPGPVWSEIVVQNYGGTPAPSNVTGGTIFAQGGARVTGTPGVNTPPGQPQRPVSTQIDEYLAAHNGAADPNALYTVWAGANDVFYQLGALQGGAIDAAGLQANVLAAATAEIGQIRRLMAAGARYVAVFTLPNIGATPAFATNPLAPQITALSAGYNTTLFTGLQGSGVRVIPVDTFSLFNQILANPAAYGFTNTTSVACGPFPPAAPAGGNSFFCYTGNLVAPGADQTYVFADPVHPTTGAQRIVAQFVESLISAPADYGLMAESAVHSRRSEIRTISDGLVRSRKDDGGILGVFVGGDATDFDIEQGAGTAGVDNRIRSATVGLTMRASEAVTVGVAYGYSQNKASLGSNGGYHNDEHAWSAFGAVRWGGFYGTGVFSMADIKFTDINRRIQLGNVVSTTNANAQGSNSSAYLSAGYDFAVGRFTIGPTVAVTSQDVTVNAFDETGGGAAGLRIQQQKRKSEVWSVGGVASMDLGGWTPWLRVTADKERRDDPRVVSATPLSMVAINTTYDVPTYQPDTSWVTTSIGVAGRLAPKVGLSLVYTRVDGRTGIKEDGFSGMVSFQF